MITTIIIFFIILGILVLAHEAGHFFTARWFGVKAEEFGFGYPPRMIGWVKNDQGKWQRVGRKAKAENFAKTIWSLNWLPLGGFVQIKGENENELKTSDSFASRKIWQRIIMLASGVIMNVILAIIILSIGFMVGIPSILDNQTLHSVSSVSQEKIQIIDIGSSSPAEIAGLKIGDAIISLNNQPMNSIEDIQNFLADKNNQEIDLTYSRGGEEQTLKITPQILENSDRPMLGVGLVKTGIVTYPWYMALEKGFEATWQLLIAMFIAFGTLLKNLFVHGSVPADIAGPVGIAVITGQFARMGIYYLLQFVALLSLNLAILNILPFPALDGGRILFLIIEAIFRKPVPQKVEAIIHNVGFMLLMALVTLVTFKDILKFF